MVSRAEPALTRGVSVSRRHPTSPAGTRGIQPATGYVGQRSHPEQTAPLLGPGAALRPRLERTDRPGEGVYSWPLGAHDSALAFSAIGQLISVADRKQRELSRGSSRS